jgi:hypothetical protein
LKNPPPDDVISEPPAFAPKEDPPAPKIEVPKVEVKESS